jgi:DNA-directed RNA polymerase subunit RPC12/RpoP
MIATGPKIECMFCGEQIRIADFDLLLPGDQFVCLSCGNKHHVKRIKKMEVEIEDHAA